MTRTIHARHSEAALDRQLADAQEATYRQMEKARDAQRYRPEPPAKVSPKPPAKVSTKPTLRRTEKITPRSTSSPNVEDVDQPKVPPGHLLLSPREVAMLGRLVDAHPLAKK